MNDYNGWTNWETWNANLWLTNDEVTFNCLKMCKDENGVAGIFNEFFPESVDGIEVEKINFREIFLTLSEV